MFLCTNSVNKHKLQQLTPYEYNLIADNEFLDEKLSSNKDLSCL